MRARTGFVSNSSSSSFILRGKDRESYKVRFECEIDLYDLDRGFIETYIKKHDETALYVETDSGFRPETLKELVGLVVSRLTDMTFDRDNISNVEFVDEETTIEHVESY